MAIRHENRMDVKEGCHLDSGGSGTRTAVIPRYHRFGAGVWLLRPVCTSRKMAASRTCEFHTNSIEPSLRPALAMRSTTRTARMIHPNVTATSRAAACTMAATDASSSASRMAWRP